MQGNASHLPTQEPTPAIRNGNQQVSVERAVVSISEPVGRVEVSDADIFSLVVRIHCMESVPNELHVDEEGNVGEDGYGVEIIRGEISDEDYFDGGPWVSKGIPTGYTAMMSLSWIDGAMIGGRGE